MPKGIKAAAAAQGLPDQRLIKLWIEEALVQIEGNDPQPRSHPSYSGRFIIRMPESLHAELARAAEQEGVSLNQFITTALAGAVSWRRSSGRSVA